MTVRPRQPDDEGQLQELMAALLGSRAEIPYDFSAEQVFVWDCGSGRLGSFSSASIRPWSTGSDSMPVPHVEGWYVDDLLRRKGIGRWLMEAIESWALAAGFSEVTQPEGARPTIVDDRNFYRVAGVKKWVKNGFLRKDLKLPLGAIHSMRTQIEADLLIQNLFLVADAMGLGAWIHGAISPPVLLGDPIRT